MPYHFFTYWIIYSQNVQLIISSQCWYAPIIITQSRPIFIHIMKYWTVEVGSLSITFFCCPRWLFQLESKTNPQGFVPLLSLSHSQSLPQQHHKTFSVEFIPRLINTHMKLKTNPNSCNRNLIMTDPTKTVHIIITISKPWQNYCIIFFLTLCLYVQHKKKKRVKKKNSKFWAIKWMTRKIKTDRLSVKHHLVTHRCSLSEASTHQRGLFYDPFVWKASLRVFHLSTDQISIGLSLKQRCWHCYYSRPLWSLMTFFSFWLMMLMMILI